MDRPPRSAPQLAMTAALLAWAAAPPSMAPGWSLRAREALRSDGRNPADTERMERGYYEALADSDRRLDRAGRDSPGSPRPDFGPLTVPVADVREYVLRPGVRAEHRGARWSTNARGMRDREHDVIKPAHTFRIAMAGDSIGAGWGVDDGRGFDSIWEHILNNRSVAAGGPAVEVLNHAVPGHAPGQRREHLDREGWAGSPDLVVFQGTPADFGWDDRKLRSLLPRGVGWDAGAYRDALARSGARPGGDEASYRDILRPHRAAILGGVYRAVVADCRSRGVPGVWLLLPRVGKPTPPADRARLVGMARAAGFDAVVDLSDAFDGLDPSALAIGPDDFHPDAAGHDRLARRLDEATREYLDPILTNPKPDPGGDRR